MVEVYCTAFFIDGDEFGDADSIFEYIQSNLPGYRTVCGDQNVAIFKQFYFVVGALVFEVLEECFGYHGAATLKCEIFNLASASHFTACWMALGSLIEINLLVSGQH